MASRNTPSSKPTAATPWAVAVASFANMFSVGAVYAMGLLHAQLPRLLGVPNIARYTPFAAASLGLTIGVITSASLISTPGPHGTIARGTALWGIGLAGAGFSIQHFNFEMLLLCLSVAGIGVGWTYLSVVVAVGQAFPTLASARSAIGPVGFASGAAAAFFASSVLRMDTASAANYGQNLVAAGMAFTTIGTATWFLLPDTSKANAPIKGTWTDMTGAFSFHLILLFFNALPGMAIFASLPLLVSHIWRIESLHAVLILPCSMIALGISGPLAPFLTKVCGPRFTFVGLLCLRGVLLISVSMSEHPILAIITLCVVLFGHGTGFGVLPALVKKTWPSPQSFPTSYGQVLGAWGIAGMAGCILDAALLTSPEKVSTLSLVLGTLTLAFGLMLGCISSVGSQVIPQ